MSLPEYDFKFTPDQLSAIGALLYLVYYDDLALSFYRMLPIPLLTEMQEFGGPYFALLGDVEYFVTGHDSPVD